MLLVWDFALHLMSARFLFRIEKGPPIYKKEYGVAEFTDIRFKEKESYFSSLYRDISHSSSSPFLVDGHICGSSNARSASPTGSSCCPGY